MLAIKDRLVRLLRWSEKYTKTDMVYVFKNSSWYLSNTFISWGINLAIALSFANLVPKDTFGTYQYVLSVVDIFGILVLGGLDTALGRSIARGAEGSVFEVLKEKIRWGLVGGLASLAFGAYYFFQGNTLLGSAFTIAGFFIPFWEAPGIFHSILSGKRRFDLANIYNVGVLILTALIVIPTLFLTQDLLAILTVYLATYGLTRALFFYVTLKKVPLNTEKDPAVISYGRHLTFMGFVSTLAASGDKILLFHYLGPVNVAAYVLAQVPALRANELVKIIDRIAYPKLAMQDNEILKKTLPRKMWLLVGAGVLGALLYAALAPVIFKLLFPQYLEAVVYTQALSLLMVLQPFNLLSTALSAQAKQKSLYIYNFLVPGVRLLLLFLLVPYYGIWGAVWGLLMTRVFNGALLMVLFYKS